MSKKFFSEEDFPGGIYSEVYTELANAKVAPLLSALEVMRVALTYYETKEFDSKTHGDGALQYVAEKALARVSEIMGDE